MREFSRLACALTPMAAFAQVQAPALPSRPFNDPVSQSMGAEALEKNPDLARGRALAEAEKERIPQAKALPDPSLGLGIQNDGFRRNGTGRADPSWHQLS